MIKAITLDNQEFNFTKSLLPCFIVGHEKSGASYFSINLIATIIKAGNKVIFFTAFPAGKEELLKNINNNLVVNINEDTLLSSIAPSKSLIIETGNLSLLQKVVETIPHINQYIIFIKNIEQYDQHIINIIKKYKRLIISGDYDQCISKQELKNEDRNSVITFTQPSSEDHDNIPILQLYEAYLISKQQRGIIKIV